MAENESLRAELGAMREELSGAEEGGARKASETVAQMPCGAELEQLLHDLQAKWSETSDGAEDLVKSHPIAALSAAFLAGIAVGRLMGRR